MPERGPVALRLAPGLAKALLRLCLSPEARVALGPGLDLLDWSFEAVAGLARARLETVDASRVQAALSAPEIEQLLAVIEREGAVLAPEARRRVLGALGASLAGSAALGPELLVASDLAPERVAAALTAVPVDVDGPERVVWERLCVAAARALVSGASGRPGFADASTASVLQRLRRIEDRLSVDPASSFDRAFRDALARRLDRLRWHGVDRELTLAHAVPRSLPSELRTGRRVLLLGEAGAGKTTVVSRLIIDACLAPGAETPFYLPLRALRSSRFPTARELVEASVPNLGDEAPRGWVRRALSTGALLVLDGLDELPRGRRRALFDGVEELARDTGGALRVVITSRPGATHRPAGDLYAGLRDYTPVAVEPLSTVESEALLSRWWAQAGGAEGLEGLHRTLSVARIGTLLANPLLATLFAAAYRAGGVTPSDHATTCLAAARALLRRGDAASLGGTVEARLAVVSSVALWMLSNGQAVVEPRELDEALSGLGHPAPRELRQSLVESSGCLRASPVGVAFTHLLLRDTLAAHRALHSGNLGLLVDRAHDDAWRAVVVAALSLAEGDTRHRLVSRLQSMAERRPERRSRLVALLDGR